MEEVKPEVTNEVSLADIVSSTSDAFQLNEIKQDYLLSELPSHGNCVGHAVVKHEDTSIQSWDLQIKSEVADLKSGIKNGDDDFFIKPELLVNEEVHIKDEIDARLVDQTIMMSPEVEHFYCGLCNNKFPSKKNLRKHMLHHKVDKCFKCEICLYSTQQRTSFVIHMNGHSGKEPHKCTECDYNAVNKPSLTKHMKQHSTGKPFQCKQCEFSAIRKCDLTRHLKTHTGEKLYKCNDCDFKSNRKLSLVAHMRTHSGDEPFECIQCDYKTKNSADLVEHAKIHAAANKPFLCKLCRYTSANKANVNMHIKNTHSDEIKKKLMMRNAW